MLRRYTPNPLAFSANLPDFPIFGFCRNPDMLPFGYVQPDVTGFGYVIGENVPKPGGNILLVNRFWLTRGCFHNPESVTF